MTFLTPAPASGRPPAHQRAKKSPGNLHFVDVRVGRQLRRRREELGITRKRLAEAGDLSQQQIHKYESAINRIPPEALCRFASFFNVPAVYFFEGLPPTTTGNLKTALAEIELYSRETALLIQAFERPRRFHFGCASSAASTRRRSCSNHRRPCIVTLWVCR